MQPIEVMRSYLSAMRAGDREAAFEHFADDIVGYVPGRSALAGPRRGRAAVEAYIRAAVARAGGATSLDLIDTLVGRDHVALLVHERLGTGEDVLDIPTRQRLPDPGRQDRGDPHLRGRPVR